MFGKKIQQLLKQYSEAMTDQLARIREDITREIKEQSCRQEEYEARQQEKEGRSEAQVSGQIQELTGLVRETSTAAGDLTRLVQETKKAVSRHDMVIEDMLEEWGDLREQCKTLRPSGEVENLLLLCMRYEEELHLIRQAFSDQEAWKEQLLLLEEPVEGARLLAGLSVTGRPGEMVNYDIHEVIAVTEASEEKMNGRIETVLDPGIVYRGTVRKKARVSAYRYTGE